jgi:hypothetical protein
MGNGNPHVVTINFNFNNGSPIWSVNPNSLPIPPGNAPINWNLSGNGATFPTTNGIVFPAPGLGSKNVLAWPGTTPAFQNVNKYSATDHNNLQEGDPSEVFRYTISVLHNGTTFTHDPDVTNDPPSGPGDELPGGGNPMGGPSRV